MLLLAFSHMLTLGRRRVAIALSLMDNIDLLATELEGIITFLLDIEEREPKPIPHLPRVFGRSSIQEAQQEPRSVTPLTPSPILKGDVKGASVGPSSSALYDSSSSSRNPKMLVTQTVEFTGILSGSPSISLPPSSSTIESRAKSGKRSKAIDWLLAPVTVYALRFGVLSVAIFSLGVSKSTVVFFNFNSGVLSLVLAQACFNYF